MANISDATGIIDIEGPWSEDQIKSLTYVLFFQNSLSDYGFHFIDIDNLYQELLNNKSIPFNGTGRWSFTSNLDYFNDWTDLSEDKFEMINKTLANEYQLNYQSYYLHRLNLIKTLANKNIKLLFTFGDYEPGCNVAYHMKGAMLSEISYDTVDKQYDYKFLFKEINVTNYECNLRFFTEVIMQDDESTLWNVCHNIIKRHYPSVLDKYKIESIDMLIDFVKQHDEWYNLMDSEYEELEYVPEEIQNFLSNMVKGG